MAENEALDQFKQSQQKLLDESSSLQSKLVDFNSKVDEFNNTNIPPEYELDPNLTEKGKLQKKIMEKEKEIEKLKKKLDLINIKQNHSKNFTTKLAEVYKNAVDKVGNFEGEENEIRKIKIDIEAYKKDNETLKTFILDFKNKVEPMLENSEDNNTLLEINKEVVDWVNKYKDELDQLPDAQVE